MSAYQALARFAVCALLAMIPGLGWRMVPAHACGGSKCDGVAHMADVNCNGIVRAVERDGMRPGHQCLDIDAYPDCDARGDAFLVRPCDDYLDASPLDTSGATCGLCAEDTDGDCRGDPCDNCPGISNIAQEDSDGDGIGDSCDNCPAASNPGQLNADGDSLGDACDMCPNLKDDAPQTDMDGDFYADRCDNCPSTNNPGQVDSDGDGVGDVCDAVHGAMCIPRASRLPGEDRAAPDWWSSDPCVIPGVCSKDDDPRLEDPRWRGAYQHSFSDDVGAGGTSPHVALRAVYDIEDDGRMYLYLFIASFIDASDGEDQQIFIGFAPPHALEGGHILRLRFRADDSSLTNPLAILRGASLSPCSALDADCGVDHSAYFGVFSYVSRDGGKWAYRLDAARTGEVGTWLDQDAVRVWQLDGKSAALLRIPMTAASAHASALARGFPVNHNLWLTVRASLGNDVGVIDYTWPETREALHLDSGGLTQRVTITRDPLADQEVPLWGRVHWVGDAPIPECARGISLDRFDIGLIDRGNPGGPLITTLSASGPNLFAARPLNNTGTTLEPGQIIARFRLSNWGSQIAGGSWQDIRVDPVPANTNPAVNAERMAPGEKGTIALSWTLSKEERCAYGLMREGESKDDCAELGASQKRMSHQCMLVELSSPANVEFVSDSVFRNMDFVATNSPYTRPAEIQTRGLPALPHQRMRDVYLHVRTENMPPAYTTRHGPPMSDQGASVRERYDELAAGYGTRYTYDDLLAELPRYEVHVFHDTGRKVMNGRTSVPLLEPQTSFGYFVRPGHELFGWGAALDGAEVLDRSGRRSPRLYRVRIAHEQSAIVQTRVHSLEVPDESFPPPDPAWRQDAGGGSGCTCHVSAASHAHPASVGMWLLGSLVYLLWLVRRRAPCRGQHPRGRERP